MYETILGGGLLGSLSLSMSANKNLKSANKLLKQEYNRQNQFLQQEEALAQKDRETAINDLRYNSGSDSNNDNGFISNKNIQNGLLTENPNINVKDYSNYLSSLKNVGYMKDANKKSNTIKNGLVGGFLTGNIFNSILASKI